MDTIIIYFFCILVLGILLLGVEFQKNNGVKTANYFSTLVISTAAFLFTCIISEILEGKPDLHVLNFIFNLLQYYSVDIIFMSFCRYFVCLIDDNKKHNVFTNIVFISCITSITITTVLALTKNLFIIENGYFKECSLASVPYYISAIIMLELVLTIVYNRKKLTTKQFVVAMTYVLFPIPPIVAESVTGIYYLTSVAMTVSILIIYILMQDSISIQSKIRESILEELSNKDLLTNLGNRRSYINYIKMIEQENNVGVIYTDVNGLKYTNDHFGHQAGDELLIKYSNILKYVYDESSIFRISGDEFVIILKDISFKDFDNKFKKLGDLVDTNDSIAAIGSAYGNGCKYDKLVNEAEDSMYINKKETSKYIRKRKED